MIVALAGLMCAGGRAHAAAQLPMFRSDAQRTGRTNYAATYDPRLAWTYTTGASISASPIIGQDGTVYYGAYDKNLYAVSSTGTRTWRYTTDGMITGSAATGADGSIYFGTSNGKLYGLNSDGTPKWATPYATGNQTTSVPILVGNDGIVYFGGDNYRVYALNPDKSLKWSYLTGGKIKNGITASSDGSVLYAASDDGSIYAINSNGTLKWKSTGLSPCNLTSVGSDGTIYVGATDGAFYALNPTNGTKKWTFRAASKVTSAAAIATDGTIYFGSNDSYLYALNPTGTLKWSYRVLTAVFSPPTIDYHGTVLLGTYTGNLLALDPVTGSVQWQKSVGTTGIYTSPAVASDGSIYVLDSLGKLSKFTGPVNAAPISTPEPSSLAALVGGILAVAGSSRVLRCSRKR